MVDDKQDSSKPKRRTEPVILFKETCDDSEIIKNPKYSLPPESDNPFDDIAKTPKDASSRLFARLKVNFAHNNILQKVKRPPVPTGNKL